LKTSAKAPIIIPEYAETNDAGSSDLSVVVSSYSTVSRANAESARKAFKMARELR